MDELEFALKFPFTDEARKLISQMQLSERIIEMGAERVKKALRGESAGRMVINESEIKEEIASFAAARMICGSLRNQFITNRFAVNESKMVRNHLDKADEATSEKVSSRFGIHAKDGMLDIPTYLMYSPRDRFYRLINRKIISGMVALSKSERKRLVEEAVKKHIENIPIVSDIPEPMKKAGNKVLDELPKTQTKITVREGDHPPCIMSLFENIKKHENLPHTARWYLATYLLAINMNEDQITAIFSGVPDFNEKTTRYQIAHARKKGYSVPSCSTVMSYGLCTAVCRIGSPLRWHSISEIRKKEVRK
jgi:DNA primase large subunit